MPQNASQWFAQRSVHGVGEDGAAERITSRVGYVGYPVLLDRRTLMYLASDADGSGPWLYGMDVSHRTLHRLTSGPERYTSLAPSDDGRRVVLTLALRKERSGVYRLPILQRRRPALL